MSRQSGNQEKRTTLLSFQKESNQRKRCGAESSFLHSANVWHHCGIVCKRAECKRNASTARVRARSSDANVLCERKRATAAREFPKPMSGERAVKPSFIAALPQETPAVAGSHFCLFRRSVVAAWSGGLPPKAKRYELNHSSAACGKGGV